MKNKDLRGKGVNPEYGMRYWFDNERHPYILRAFNERYLVLTKNDNLRRGSMLCIVVLAWYEKHTTVANTTDQLDLLSESLLKDVTNGTITNWVAWKQSWFKVTRLEHGKNHREPSSYKNFPITCNEDSHRTNRRHPKEPQIASLRDAVAYANKGVEEYWEEVAEQYYDNHKDIEKQRYLETEANLLAVAEVNKDLAKTVLIRYFQKIGHPFLSVFICGRRIQSDLDLELLATCSCNEVVSGVGKLIGLDTTNWRGRNDTEISRIERITKAIFALK